MRWPRTSELERMAAGDAWAHGGAEGVLTPGQAGAQQAAPLPTWFTVGNWSVEWGFDSALPNLG